MIPPVLWLIVFPIGSIVVVYWLRRSIAGALIATGVAFLSAWLAIRLPLGLVTHILGRPIELDQLSQITLALIFGAAAILFLISIPALPTTDQIRDGTKDIIIRQRRGRTFYPMGLAVLGLFVAASLSRHLGITAILVEVAAILAVFIIQGSRLKITRASQRFLIFMSLAIPLFLLAAWRIDAYQMSGGLQSGATLRLTALFTGLGFALWLAVVPFHGWLTATATEAVPWASAFILITFPIVALSTLIHLLVDTPWLVTSSDLAQAMMIAGIFTAFVGGILSGIQRGFSELLGYSALYDLGCTLTILALGGEAAILTILVSLTVRVLALTLIVACIAALRLQIGDVGFSRVKGKAQQMPLATLGLLIGGFTLAGTPLTIGFAPRWQLIQVLSETYPQGPALLILAGLGVVVGYLRGFRALLPESTASFSLSSLTMKEPYILIAVIGILAIICLLMGLYPAWLIEPLQKLALDSSLPIR